MFYTCHCTGEAAFKIMQLAMKDKLQYIHSGEEVKLNESFVKQAQEQEAGKTGQTTGQTAGKRVVQTAKDTGKSAEYKIKETGANNIKLKKGGSSFMKWHKFYAWATVFCFVMTMITGYKRK